MTEIKEVTIYTDGACVGNPGPGGYGVVLLFGNRRKELSGGFRQTTNNRMELLAVVVGLESLKDNCRVTLHSDSKYMVDNMNKGSAREWQANRWLLNKRKKAANADLWERLLTVCDRHEVEFFWVKGHAGDRENERCDALSWIAANGDNLTDDSGFEVDPQLGFDFPQKKSQAENASHAKITTEGQPCRKCGTPVVKRTPKRKKRKKGQEYYFEYYFNCPDCGNNYMVEAAKRFFE